MAPYYDHKKVMPFERVYIDHEHEGKIVLDIRPKFCSGKKEIVSSNSQHHAKNEKVLILLHGVTGSSEDCYMQDLSGLCAENGINVVLFNHYAPEGEYGVRLMDLGKNRYLDEVIQYAQ